MEMLLGGAGNVINKAERFDDAYDQRQIIDYLVKLGDIFIDVEVKYGIPKTGSAAMKRLISQVDAMPKTKGRAGILIIFKEIAEDSADMNRLRKALEQGGGGLPRFQATR